MALSGGFPLPIVLFAFLETLLQDGTGPDSFFLELANPDGSLHAGSATIPLRCTRGMLGTG